MTNYPRIETLGLTIVHTTTHVNRYGVELTTQLGNAGEYTRNETSIILLGPCGYRRRVPAPGPVLLRSLLFRHSRWCRNR